MAGHIRPDETSLKFSLSVANAGAFADCAGKLRENGEQPPRDFPLRKYSPATLRVNTSFRERYCHSQHLSRPYLAGGFEKRPAKGEEMDRFFFSATALIEGGCGILLALRGLAILGGWATPPIAELWPGGVRWIVSIELLTAGLAFLCASLALYVLRRAVE
jgi:hypothetical protein